MLIELHDVSKGKNGEVLPPAHVAYGSGEAVLAVAETEQRPTVLGLIASGRMNPDAGTVTIDGTDDGRALRRRVALVDAPPVCDPEPNVTVTGLTVEELMFAGRSSTVPAARRWLAEHGFGELARKPIGELVPRDRIELLMQLTALRPDVEGLVLVSPDRHRGEPAEWWHTASRFAADGYAVLVVAGAAAERVLAELPDPDGESDQPVEIEPRVAIEGEADAAQPAPEADAAQPAHEPAPEAGAAQPAPEADAAQPAPGADAPELTPEPRPEMDVTEPTPEPTPEPRPEAEPAPEPGTEAHTDTDTDTETDEEGAR